MLIMTKKALFASIAAGVMASSAMAADAEITSSTAIERVNTFDTLPDEGTVKINGVVQTVDNNREFVLADTSGSVKVELATPTAVGPGDEVTVIGRVDDPWYRSPSLKEAQVMPMEQIGDLSANETRNQPRATASQARAEARTDKDYIDADVETRRLPAGTDKPITGAARQDSNSNAGLAKFDRNNQYKADIDVDVDKHGNANAKADVDAAE